jgi:HK97 family phage major capsid protein
MDPKELAKKIEEAVSELHKAIERQDAEIKKFGEPSAEEKAKEAKIQADITSLMEQKAEWEEMQKRIDDLELKMGRGALVKPGEGDKTPEQKARKDAFYKFVRQGEQMLTPEEKKALVEDATGQYLIEPELDAEIERLLPKITIVRGLATVRTIGKDRMKMKSIGGVSVGWGKLETGTEITESTLTPGAPTYQYVEDLYGLSKIGEDELMDSDVPLESILGEEFSRALGEEEDKQFILGAGHGSNQPEGITKNATLIAATKTTAAADAIVVEDMMDMMYACPTQFRRNGSFIVNSLTELALRKLRFATGAGAGTGGFIWEASVQVGTPNTLLGRPIYTQDDMKSLADAAQVIAIFGDIRAGYRIIDRVGMSLQRLTELYAEAGLVGFKIHKRVTGGVMKASQKPIVLLTEKAA